MSRRKDLPSDVGEVLAMIERNVRLEAQLIDLDQLLEEARREKTA